MQSAARVQVALGTQDGHLPSYRKRSQQLIRAVAGTPSHAEKATAGPLEPAHSHY